MTERIEFDPGLFRAPPTGHCFLVGGKCRACSTFTWGLKSICPGCWNEATQDEVPIGKRGVLYSATTVRVAPAGFTVPYMMGVIDLPEGLRIVGRVVSDNGEWSKDAPVALEAGVLSRNDAGGQVIGPVFRVLSSES